MGRRLFLGLACLCAAAAARAEESRGPLTLWYTKPAASWVEALPVGNGRLDLLLTL